MYFNFTLHTSHFKKMFLLNLPEYAHKITKKNGELYIYDKIRKKNLVFTPEEYVRQQLICLLCALEYPLALMRAESGLNYNKRQKRTDLIVYDRFGEPFLLLECKAMYIKLSDNTIFQVSQYNFIIKARYVMISNGVEACFYEMDYINNKHIQLAEIPVFE